MGVVMREIIAYAAMFDDQGTLNSMVAEDNHVWWNPLSIFKDPLEAARWLQSKNIDNINGDLIKKVKIIISD